MFDWMKRRIQPLQARESFGFQYQGTTDPSRLLEEEISDDIAFSREKRLLKNVDNVPVVPGNFLLRIHLNRYLIRVVDT